MQRIEMVAAGFENPRVDFLGAGEIALAVQGDGLFERLREIRCDGPGHGRTIGRGGRRWLGVKVGSGSIGDFCSDAAVC
jgi:hypothetical protein